MPRDNVSTIGPRASATSSLPPGAANRHAEEATGPRSAKWPAYVPPFDKIRKMLAWPTSGSELTQIPQALKETIRLIIFSIPIDEEWYLRKYPDVVEGIKKGVAGSARDHFINHGYFEGRIPFPMFVDPEWYLKENPDVAEAIRRGSWRSAQQHFDQLGYKEGRLPFTI